MMPLVSITLPTYNRCKWLQESLDSIYWQKGVRKQLIILNNGCTDGTSEVIDNIRRECFEEVKILYRSQNSFQNILAMRRFVKGDFVVEFTDDDMMLPGHLAMLLYQFDRPNVGMVYSKAQCIDANGNPDGLFKGEHPGESLSESFLTTSLAPMPATMMRRECYYLPINSRLSCGGEWARHVEIAMQGYSIKFLPDAGINLRIHDNSDTMERGFKMGKFIDMHLQTWEYWICTRGVRVSEPTKDRMRDIYVNLLMFAEKDLPTISIEMDKLNNILEGTWHKT